MNNKPRKCAQSPRASVVSLHLFWSICCCHIILSTFFAQCASQLYFVARILTSSKRSLCVENLPYIYKIYAICRISADACLTRQLQRYLVEDAKSNKIKWFSSFFFGRRSCLAVYRVSRQPFSDSLQNFDDVDEALQSGVHDWDGVEKTNSSEKQAKWNSDSKWCCNFKSRRLNFPSHAQIDVAAAAVDCPMSFVRTLINDCIVRTQRQTEISCGCIKNMGRWLKIGTKKKNMKHIWPNSHVICE